MASGEVIGSEVNGRKGKRGLSDGQEGKSLGEEGVGRRNAEGGGVVVSEGGWGRESGVGGDARIVGGRGPDVNRRTGAQSALFWHLIRFHRAIVSYDPDFQNWE